MTTQTLAELNKILDQFKAGEIRKLEAIKRLDRLYSREPVNYKRQPLMTHGKNQVQEPKLPGVGEKIELYGFGEIDGTYTIMRPKPGSTTLRLGAKE